MAYRIECSREYGILLWMDAPCGIKQPIMRWENLEEVKTFGEGILNFYNYRQRILNEADREKVENDYSAADNLLRQVFGDDGDYFNQKE
jgi:hypothetical protein